MLTHDDVLAMDEATLRREVLVPLFRAMGHLDVTEYHGARELGKDIVMWDRDSLRGRVNWAVVVKTGPITGQASGPNSAAAVFTQIQQAFGSPFADPAKPGEQIVHQVLVVSSRPIRTEARVTFNSLLGSTPWSRSVAYLHGDELWAAIETYLGERTLLPMLAEIGRALNQVAGQQTIRAAIDGEHVQLVVGGGSSPAEPAKRAVFRFPPTEGGEVARRAFQRHFTAGEPAVIKGEYIAEFPLPEILRRLGVEGIASVALPARELPSRLFHIEVSSSETGDRVRFENVPFTAHGGTDEVVLASSQPHLPISLRLVFNRVNRSATGHIQSRSDARNVEQLLDMARLANIAASGGRLRVEDATTRQVLFAFAVTPTDVQAPPDGWMRFLERVQTIQRLTGVAISIPDREIALDEIRRVDFIAQALETGRIVRSVTSLTLTLTRAGVERVLDIARERQPAPILVVNRERHDVFGVSIEIGKVVRQVSGLGLTRAERDRLGEELQRGADAVKVIVSPVAGPGQEVDLFVDWLPAEEAQPLRERFGLSATATDEEHVATGEVANRARVAALLMQLHDELAANAGAWEACRDDPDASRFIRDNAFAFLLAVIADYRVDADVAWRLPWRLSAQLGHLDPSQISAITPTALESAVRAVPQAHRHPAEVAKYFIRAAAKVVSEYGGDAANVWAGRIIPDALLHFDAFPGIGQKKASMAVNILYRDLHRLQPDESGLRLLDVSYDMHVRRVFQRTGLVEHDSLQEVIGAARTLNPAYPGKLDLGAWHVGRTWCHPTDPDCAACRLRPACARVGGSSGI